MLYPFNQSKVKKTLILSLILAFTFSPVASAQVIQADLTPESRAAIVSDIEKKINDLMIQILLAKIAELQAQIAEILAKQATQTTQLGVVEQKVDSVVTQTKPVTKPTPPAPTLGMVTLGTPYCATMMTPDGSGIVGRMIPSDERELRVPIILSGASWPPVISDMEVVGSFRGRGIVGGPETDTELNSHGLRYFVVHKAALLNPSSVSFKLQARRWNQDKKMHDAVATGEQVIDLSLDCAKN